MIVSSEVLDTVQIFLHRRLPLSVDIVTPSREVDALRTEGG